MKRQKRRLLSKACLNNIAFLSRACSLWHRSADVCAFGGIRLSFETMASRTHKLLGLCRLVRPVLRRSVPTKTGSIIASQFLAAILRFCRYGKRFFGFASLNEPFEIAPDWFASSRTSGLLRPRANRLSQA